MWWLRRESSIWQRIKLRVTIRHDKRVLKHRRGGYSGCLSYTHSAADHSLRRHRSGTLLKVESLAVLGQRVDRRLLLSDPLGRRPKRVAQFAFEPTASYPAVDDGRPSTRTPVRCRHWIRHAVGPAPLLAVRHQLLGGRPVQRFTIFYSTWIETKHLSQQKSYYFCRNNLLLLAYVNSCNCSCYILQLIRLSFFLRSLYNIVWIITIIIKINCQHISVL